MDGEGVACAKGILLGILVVISLSQGGVGQAVNRPYLCPICKSNRREFELVYKLAQEIQKDPETGETLFRSDELTTLTKDDGRPDIDVKCRQCGYIGAETAFSRAARRKEQAALRSF